MNNKHILILSYYACMPGACQAEWLDDKIDSLTKAGFTVSLISSSCAKIYPNESVTHYRIPSISFSDFWDEMRRIRNRGEKIKLQFLLILPLVLSIGLIFDLLQIVVTRGVGEGRWTWTLPSFFAALLYTVRLRPHLVLSTGGPASAHLSAILIGKIFFIPVICELQDPLSGGDIGRNTQARGWLYRVEKLIVEYADKIVYVTKGAADFAFTQFGSKKTVGIYPGARDFGISKRPQENIKISKFRMVHLGSLYATRNFKSVIGAIDKLIAENAINVDDIELINLGHVSPDIYAEIIQKKYVKVMPPVAREEALKFASCCDITLLIQNADDRSMVTIPYKTYDYLNLPTKILALLNSDELTNLINEYGHIAVPLSEVQEISLNIKRLIDNPLDASRPFKKINAIDQAIFLIDLGTFSYEN